MSLCRSGQPPSSRGPIGTRPSGECHHCRRVTHIQSLINLQSRYATVTALSIEDVLKGRGLEGEIQITELGGLSATSGGHIGGGAIYAPGERVLVFLEKTGQGYHTWVMMLIDIRLR